MSGGPARRSGWFPSRPARNPGRRVAGRRVAGWLLVALVLAVATAGLARLRLDTSVSALLPADDPALTALTARDRSFGGDPIAVLLESNTPRGFLVGGPNDTGGRPGDAEGGDELPRLLELEGRLATLPDVAAVYGPATVLNQLAGSAQNLLAQIGGRRAGLQAQIQQRDAAAGVGPDRTSADVAAATARFDQRYGTLLTLGMHTGLPTLRNPGFARSVIYDGAGNPRPQWRFVVPTASSVAILVRPRQDMDQAADQRLVHAVRELVEQAGLGQRRLTVTGVPAITAEATAQVSHELPYLAALALLACSAVLLVSPWLAGRRVRRLLPLSLAVLSGALVLSAIGWIGRGTSLAIIAFAPVLMGCGSDFSVYLALRVDRRTVVVTALASAVAAASLMLSPLPFTRGLGLALGAGILVVTALACWLTGRRSPIPSFARPTEQVGPALPEAAGPEAAGPDAAGLDAAGADAAGRGAAGAGAAGRGRGRGPARRGGARAARLPVRIGAALAAVAVGAVGWAGLAGLPIEANPLRLAQGLPAVADAMHAQDLMGSSAEVGLLVSAPDVLTPGVLEWSRRAEDAVVASVGDTLHPVLTMPDLLRFLGANPTQGEIDSATQLLPSYLTGAVVRYDRNQAMMIFGTGLDDLAAEQRVLDRARAVLPAPPPGVRAELVGLPVAAVRGFALLSGDRYLGNLVGVLAAALVLALGLRHRGDAVRALVAALLCTGWGLAVLTVFGIAVSPLTAALGSLATVTATEFTVLLAAARRDRRPELGLAVLTAGLAATVGYLSLLGSQLRPLAQFGLLLASVVALSYLAARLILWVAPPVLAPARSVAASDRDIPVAAGH